MDASATRGPKASAPSFAELFTPKLVTILREGYGLGPVPGRRHRRIDRRHRGIAALDGHRHRLGIVSGPGLNTAIVGGFLISALGGSRFQIGGPAGAFIVLDREHRRAARL